MELKNKRTKVYSQRTGSRGRNIHRNHMKRYRFQRKFVVREKYMIKGRRRGKEREKRI